MALPKKPLKHQKPTFVSHILTNEDNNSYIDTKSESCFYVPLGNHHEMHLEPNLLPGEIVISQVGKVTRYVPYSNDKSGQIGTLFVTNYRVSYVTYLADSLSNETKFCGRHNKLIGKDDIALTNILEIYLTSKGKRRKYTKGSFSIKTMIPVQCLELHSKDFRIHSFYFENCDQNDVLKTINSTVHHAFPLKTDLLFVFAFEMDKCCSEIDLCNIMNFTSFRDWDDLLHQLRASNVFRVTKCNAEFAVSDSLPEYFVVPFALEDTEIVNKKVERELDKRAIPLWSYSYANGSALIRMAYGLGTHAHDSMLEFVRRKDHPKEPDPYVVDLGNVDLPSLKELQMAYERLREHCMPPTNKDLWSSDLTWFSALEGSQWLYYVSKAIDVACRVVSSMLRNTNVVIREKDGGTDFSPVVSCLAQLMMDASSRTITGFQSLVEKEWVALGHRFADRCGVIYQNEGEESPLFLLFLDCVWQLLQQFPSSFEFSEIYLTSLWDSIGLAMFHNFIFNGPRDRSSALASLLQRLAPAKSSWNLSNYVMSVWDWQRQFSAGDIALFTNPLYVAHSQLQDWQGCDCRLSEAYGAKVAACQNGHHKSGSLTPRQAVDMRPFRISQSVHGSASLFAHDVLRPGYAMPQIRLWEHCYLRWLTPVEIVGGGMPCEYLAQSALMGEIKALQNKISKIESSQAASVTINLPKKPRKLFGPSLSVATAPLECVSSSYPFSPTRPSNLSIIPVVSPTLRQNSVDSSSSRSSYV